MTLVRHDRELPRPKVGEGLLDSGIGPHPLSDGLRLDALKLPNGPHELVPGQIAPLRVDRLDGGPDPLRRFGARHRGPVDRREARAIPVAMAWPRLQLRRPPPSPPLTAACVPGTAGARGSAGMPPPSRTTQSPSSPPTRSRSGRPSVSPSTPSPAGTAMPNSS